MPRYEIVKTPPDEDIVPGLHYPTRVELKRVMSKRSSRFMFLSSVVMVLVVAAVTIVVLDAALSLVRVLADVFLS